MFKGILFEAMLEQRMGDAITSFLRGMNTAFLYADMFGVPRLWSKSELMAAGKDFIADAKSDGEEQRKWIEIQRQLHD